MNSVNPFETVLRTIEQRTPCTILTAMIAERAFSAEALDGLFEKNRTHQHTRTLLFSTVVQLMSEVVSHARSSVHQVYQQQKERLKVSLKSIYNKLNGMDTALSEALVSYVASHCTQIIEAMPGAALPSVLHSFPVVIWDGNLLAPTDHRVGVLRTIRSDALPGSSLVLLNPQRGIVEQVIERTDAYSNERASTEPLLAKTPTGYCVVADRNFCTKELLLGWAKKGRFVVRHHAGLHVRLLKELKAPLLTDRGRIEEWQVCFEDESGKEHGFRRVSLYLNTPTRNGEKEVHVLTNLSETEASGMVVMEVYKGRWSIEGVFQQLEKLFQSEVQSLGYPKAALFAFCVAMCAFNLYSTVKAALRSAHGREKVEQDLSNFAVVQEVQVRWEGVQIVLQELPWDNWQSTSLQSFVHELLRVARLFRFDAYLKAKRGPKKPRHTFSTHSPHVSTQRLLDDRLKKWVLK
jgi:hypothetical protein